MLKDNRMFDMFVFFICNNEQTTKFTTEVANVNFGHLNKTIQ